MRPPRPSHHLLHCPGSPCYFSMPLPFLPSFSHTLDIRAWEDVAWSISAWPVSLGRLHHTTSNGTNSLPVIGSVQCVKVFLPHTPSHCTPQWIIQSFYNSSSSSHLPVHTTGSVNGGHGFLPTTAHNNWHWGLGHVGILFPQQYQNVAMYRQVILLLVRPSSFYSTSDT